MKKCGSCISGIAVASEGMVIVYDNQDSYNDFSGIAFYFCPMCGHKNLRFKEMMKEDNEG